MQLSLCEIGCCIPLRVWFGLYTYILIYVYRFMGHISLKGLNKNQLVFFHLAHSLGQMPVLNYGNLYIPTVLIRKKVLRECLSQLRTRMGKVEGSPLDRPLLAHPHLIWGCAKQMCLHPLFCTERLIGPVGGIVSKIKCILYISLLTFYWQSQTDDKKFYVLQTRKMTRYNLPILVISAITGATAASLIFAQWGNSNNYLKRTQVMYMMIGMVSVSTFLLSCLLFLSEYR